MRIRTADVHDAEELSVFAARLFFETFGAANPPETMQRYLRATFREEKQRAELESVDHAIYLAETEAGRWLGFLHLCVWEQNARAKAFYAKEGFRPIGEQRFDLGGDLQRDEVWMLRL